MGLRECGALYGDLVTGALSCLFRAWIGNISQVAFVDFRVRVGHIGMYMRSLTVRVNS
jgi:hypothetical protein